MKGTQLGGKEKGRSVNCGSTDAAWQDSCRVWPKSWKMLALFFMLSLVIRVGFLVPVVTSGVIPAFDERGYFSRAVAASDAMGDLVSGRLPSSEHLLSLYGHGRQGGKWPPFHSVLLGSALLLFGPEETVARAVVVLLSSITTPLVLALSLELSNRKAAVIAALAHTFYPSFVAYSHYLWSETTFILLLLSSIYCAIRLVDADAHRKALIYAVLCGSLLGLCGLTRAAVLPYLFAIPVWLALRMKGTRFGLMLSVVVAVSWFVVLLPWEVALALDTKSIVPISTGGSYNLYLGNNPWVPEGLGASWGHAESKRLAENAIETYQSTHAVDYETAAWALAMKEIGQKPVTFLSRCIHRFRMLWSVDMFALRHLFRAVYPPLPPGILALLSVIVMVSYLLLASLALHGLIGADSLLRHRDLVLMLLLAGMAAPAVTIGMSRLHMPLLAVSLPAAGCGVVSLGPRPLSARGLVTVSLKVVLIVGVLTSLPLVVTYHLAPSSYYLALVEQIDAVLASDALYMDSVSFKWEGSNASDHVAITILGEDYVFSTSQTDKYVWETSKDGEVLNLHVSTSTARSPLRIELSSQGVDQTVVIEPIQASYWGKWRPSTLGGLMYRWDGGRGREEGKIEE